MVIYFLTVLEGMGNQRDRSVVRTVLPFFFIFIKPAIYHGYTSFSAFLLQSIDSSSFPKTSLTKVIYISKELNVIV